MNDKNLINEDENIESKEFPEIGYLNRQEYLNLLRNTIINDILYDQIRFAFPELLLEKRSLTDKEIENIFSHIRNKADSSMICKRLIEKIDGKYNMLISKYDTLIKRHNYNYLKNRNNNQNAKLVTDVGNISVNSATDLVTYTKSILQSVKENTEYVKSVNKLRKR